MLVPTPAAAPPTDGVAGWVVQVMDAVGAPGVGLLVGVENLFPPLPSEVILPLAGFSASLGTLSLVGAIVWATLGSVVGAWALYGLGHVLGRERIVRLLEKMPLVDVDDMLRAEEFFVRHGSTAVLVGRVVPVVRSLVSIPAGLERMPLLRFTVLTGLGSLVWNAALVLAGYALGEQYGLVAHYLEYVQYVVLAAVAVGLAFYVRTRLRRRRAGEREASRDEGESHGRDDTTRETARR
ncbi:DedA family protein [Mobilicoccus pelagius]|uniref:VTT domain-containing protein n=1 Tax=Mobilicoccus pelagius NBRC 104925 TaxID=1089455 RepID=H5URN7_9MICO|nr:DedA family protein [Mobilicoccus pelagius]GAB48395.1 hypothetical protein MOPEL_073_00350 [Mobilicoccus pelagius NBRC 104925]